MNEVGFGERVLAAVSPPWAGFVAAFIYFTLLTATVIGGVNISGVVVAGAYLLPIGMYLALLATRAVHALASLDVGLRHEPHALLR